MGLISVSRTDLLVRLAQLRAPGILREIWSEDLCSTYEEVIIFFMKSKKISFIPVGIDSLTDQSGNLNIGTMMNKYFATLNLKRAEYYHLLTPILLVILHNP